MKVIAVFKTHVDIGFTDSPKKILERYSSNMLFKVAEICEKTKECKNPFVWTMPAFVLHYALRTCTEELKDRIEKLIRDDKIVWHALPLTLRTEFFSEFELKQTLFYAKELCRVYEKPMPISAKMTDVPGHTQALVDVLVESGVKFLHLGCNPASTSPDVPRLFFWQSKKGNRILTYYDRDYGGSVVPPADWHFPVHLCMTVSGDNMGVQSESTISELEAQLKAYDPSAEFTTGSMDDFARELFSCDLSDVPTVKGELGDTWIAGLGAFPSGCSAVYGVRQEFEKLSLFLQEKNDTQFQALQREYLEKAMLFGEHSGGVDVKKYISNIRVYDKAALLEALKSPAYLYAQSGWNDELSWCYEARDAFFTLKKQVEEKYGCFTQEKQTKVCKNKTFTVSYDENNIRISNNETGKGIKVGYLYEVIGRDTIDKYMDGYLTRKFDWALADFGRYQMNGTNTYPDISDKTFLPSVTAITDNGDCICVEYRTDDESHNVYGNAERITISAKAMGDRVLVSVDILNKQPTLYVEGGYVYFHLEDGFEDIVICKSGVEINPERDIVSRANSALFATEYVKAGGFRLESIHAPLTCFGEPKIYRSNTGKFILPENGKIFFNTFNNMWATGCPQWISGSYHLEFYILSE